MYQANKKTEPHKIKIGEFYPSGWVNGAVAYENPKSFTRDTIQTRTMFLQNAWVDLQSQMQQFLMFIGFQQKRSLIGGLTIPQTTPWDITLIRLYIHFELYTHKVGCPSDMYCIKKVIEPACIWMHTSSYSFFGFLIFFEGIFRVLGFLCFRLS
jgi:hypothetical protein